MGEKRGKGRPRVCGADMRRGRHAGVRTNMVVKWKADATSVAYINYHYHGLD